MTVRISFVRAEHIGGSELLIGAARAMEAVAVPGTTTTVARADEVAYVVNDGTDSVLVAVGTTPDAAATAETTATSAGMAIPKRQALFLALREGQKLNAKAPA